MPISPDEIAGKRFVVTLRGYDRAEVDSYLRALAADQTRLLDRIKDLEAVSSRGSTAGGSGAPETILEQAIEALTGLRRSLGDGPPAASRAVQPAKVHAAPRSAAEPSKTPAAKTPAGKTVARKTIAKKTGAKKTGASKAVAGKAVARKTPSRVVKASPAPAKRNKANPAPVKATKAAPGRAGAGGGRQAPHEATARASRSAG